MDTHEVIISLIVLVMSISFHEFGHAVVADVLGDNGPRDAGRLTILPTKHLDLLGTACIVVSTMLGYGFGWGKPVQVDPSKLRNSRLGMLAVIAAGPGMNVLLAICFGLFIRFYLPLNVYFFLRSGGYPTVIGEFCFMFLQLNLLLFFINLLPVFPLDGSKLLSGILPYTLAGKYEKIMFPASPYLLVLLLLTGSRFLGPALGSSISTASKLITGMSF